MTKFLKILLVLLLILQLLVASSFELAHDEAYYWLFSRNLAWGYFDHPPLVAVIIRLFSFLPHGELSVRVGFILLQFSSLFLLLKLLGKEWHDRATILFFAFPLASLTGLFALPDMPLLFMTICYCYGLKIHLEKKTYASSLGLAVIIALLLNAKYHGILLVFFTVLALPKLFKEPKFYLTALAALLLFTPHILWQYDHEFATIRYHFLERPSSDFSVKRLTEYLGVQLGLAGVFVGPVIWWIVIRKKSQSEFERAMKFISLGTVIFFFLSTVTKKFEANWTIFLAGPLILLAVSSEVLEKKVVKWLLYGSFSLVVIVRLIFVFPPDTFKLKRLQEFNGWDVWAKQVKSKCSGSLVANTYQVASKLSFYLNEEVHSLNYHSRKNQFDFWRFDLKNPIKDVCYLTDKREFSGEPIATPEGKNLLLVKNLSYEELLSRKQRLVR